jgi:uncharacterized protein
MRFLIFLLIPFSLLAQKKAAPKLPTMQLLTRYDGEKVILRWANSNFAEFMEGSQTGYNIERLEVDTSLRVLEKRVLTTAPIKPAPLATFETYHKAGNRHAAAAAQSIYGKRMTQPLSEFDLGKAYEQHQESQMRFMTLALVADWDAQVAEAVGWRFEDKTIQKGKNYLYRIIKPQSTERVADTSGTFVSTFTKESTPSVPPVNFQGSEHAVTLFWQKPLPPFGFSGYFIEKSDDDGKIFKRTTNTPRIFVSDSRKDSGAIARIEYFTDSVETNEKVYHYRIIGLDAFGLLSQASNIVLAKGRDLTPPPPATDVVLTQLNDHTVLINWQEPNPIPPDFGGYLVSKSPLLEESYMPMTQQILPRGITQWIDSSATGNTKTYYRVTVVDTFLNVAHAQPAYLFYKDEKPPAPATQLTGTIDTFGHVTVRWKAPADGDLLGYIVERANDSTHVGIPITKGTLAQVVFYDTITLKTLSKKIYYRVLAVDLSHKSSPPSAWLELKKPDIVPPMPPVITNFVVTDSSVTFSWTPSPSEDVKKLILMKKQEDGSFEKWQEVAPSVITTIDKAVIAKNWYEYALIAVDSTGLSSEMSFPLRVRVYPSNRSPEFVTSLKATLASNKSNIALSWSTASSTEKRFLLYRNTEGGGWEMFKALDGKTSEFSDKDIQLKRNYQYAIKTILKDGIESGLATSVAILVE